MSSSRTLLENLLLCDGKEDANIQVNAENMCAVLLDFSNDEDVRFTALELFYKIHGYEVVEILKKLVSVFCMSQTKLFQQFLLRICKHSSLPFSLRLETCKDICYYKDNDVELFELLHALINEIPSVNESKKEEITFVKELEAIMTLMRNDNFVSQSKMNMKNFLNKKKDLTCDYRYKSITSLQTNFDQRKRWLTKEEREMLDKTLYDYQLDLFTFFASDKDNDATYRILSAQFLLSQIEKFESDVERQKIINFNLCTILLDIGNDQINVYNTRADAIDVVLRFGIDLDCKEKAKEKMLCLAKEGADKKGVFTIYNNAQNAHADSIEKSALETFQQLSRFPFLSEFSLPIFERICETIKPHLNDNGNMALTRITLDNAVYGNLKLTLKSALFLVYKYIEQVADTGTKQLLFSRLYEELSESAGICSTGIFERMANTFTGIIDALGIFISLEDQIMAVFATKLTNAITSLEKKACVHSLFCSCQDYICNAGKFFISLFCSWENNSDKFLIDEETFFLCKQHESETCGECTFCQNRKVIRDKIKVQKIKHIDKSNSTLLCVHQCKENENCNVSFMERLLEEMMIPVGLHYKRKTFLTFFRKFFPDIYSEIANEYVGTFDKPKILDHTSFDLYIRKAVLQYVGEE